MSEKKVGFLQTDMHGDRGNYGKIVGVSSQHKEEIGIMIDFTPDESQQIIEKKNNFMGNIKDEFFAITIHYFMVFDKERYFLEKLADNPEMIFCLSSIPKFSPLDHVPFSYKEMKEKWESQFDVLSRIVHNSSIQNYYVYLFDIFSILFAKPEVDKQLLPKCIKEADDFDLKINGKDKAKTIKKILGLDENQLADKLIKNINRNIAFRNCFEHNKGIVRQRDLNDMGDSSYQFIRSINNGQKIDKTLNKGDEIRITLSELYFLRDNLVQLAASLPPIGGMECGSVKKVPFFRLLSEQESLQVETFICSDPQT